MSLVLFFIVLAVLILSHEFGHFIAAKKSGIRVDEFGFGFPPRLFGFKKGGTDYSINLIPFGGFVKIHGEEGENAHDKTSFSSKSIGARALVIAAGVIFNIILAWFLISAGYMAGMPTSSGTVPAGAEINNKKVIILEVQENSPAKAVATSTSPPPFCAALSSAEPGVGPIASFASKQTPLTAIGMFVLLEFRVTMRPP